MDDGPPRVLQAIAGGRWGGAEAFFCRLVPALARAGVPQRLLVGAKRPWTARLEAAGLEPAALPFGGPFDLATRRRFAAEIAAFRPHIVLTWMNRASRFCPPARGRFVHLARLGGYYDLKYYRRCDHLIGNTADILRHMEAGGWPTERAHHIPNFADTSPMPAVPRAAFDTPEGAPLVLALGRLHRVKGFDTLLRAMACLPEAWLWLAGEGPERGALEGLVRERGLGGRVRFLGWRDDAAALFAAADLFVCPSRHEPFGSVVIEAWAHGVPAVVAASQGPGALVSAGETGLVVPIDDSEALANSLRTLMENPALAGRLADAGRAAYEAGFTEEAVVARYLALFEAVRRSCAASRA